MNGAQLNHAQQIEQKIRQRRLQILVHSHLYYVKGTSIVTDETWDRWAMELVQLQNDYPHIADSIEYYDAFDGWDGTTGFNLPLHSQWVENRANYMLKIHKKEWGVEDTGSERKAGKTGGKEAKGQSTAQQRRNSIQEGRRSLF